MLKNKGQIGSIKCRSTSSTKIEINIEKITPIQGLSNNALRFTLHNLHKRLPFTILSKEINLFMY